MYAIYGNIYHQYTPNVSIYTIHGSYGIGNDGLGTFYVKLTNTHPSIVFSEGRNNLSRRVGKRNKFERAKERRPCRNSNAVRSAWNKF